MQTLIIMRMASPSLSASRAESQEDADKRQRDHAQQNYAELE
jgi:hypothetical protein